MVHNGEWYKVATFLDDTGNVGDLPSVNETVLVAWEAEKNVAGQLVIGATINDASVIPGLSKPGIDTLNSLVNGPGTDPAVNLLAAGVQSITDPNQARKAGEQLAPETNFATQQAAITLAFLTGQYIDERLLGVGATSPGFAPPSGLGAGGNFPAPSGLGMAGSSDGRMNIGADDDTFYYDPAPYNPSYNKYGLWGQVFGAGLQQNKVAGVDGYNSNIYGGLVVLDNWVSPGFRLGFAGGWAHTSINGTGDTVRNETDANSYLGLAYGALKGAGWYFSGRAGFAWHNYDTTRVLNVGGLSDVAGASHDGRQYLGALELGAPLHYGATTLTPVVSVNYTHLNQDGYAEASTGGMALSIADQETDSLQSGLGVKAAVKVAPTALLEGRAVWYHEFDDTEQQVTAAFASVPSFTAAGPGVGRDTANLGVGLLAYTGAGTTFQIDYDALLRQDFTGHTGSAKLKIEF